MVSLSFQYIYTILSLPLSLSFSSSLSLSLHSSIVCLVRRSVFHFLSFLLVRNLYTQLLDFSFSFIFVQSPLLQRAVQRANEPNLEPCEILRESLALVLLSLALKTSNSDQNSTKITMRPSSSFSFPLIALFLSLLMTPCLAFFEHLFNQQGGGGQPQAPPSISFTDQFSSRTSLLSFTPLSLLCLTGNASIHRDADKLAGVVKDSRPLVEHLAKAKTAKMSKFSLLPPFQF